MSTVVFLASLNCSLALMWLLLHIFVLLISFIFFNSHWLILPHGCATGADTLSCLFFLHFSLSFYWDVLKLEGSFLSHVLSNASPLKTLFGGFHLHVFFLVLSAFPPLCLCCLSVMGMMTMLAISALSIPIISALWWFFHPSDRAVLFMLAVSSDHACCL